MRKLLLIIKREFLTKVRSKAYLILIFLSPLLMIGMFAAIFYFATKEEKIAETVNVLVVAPEVIQEQIAKEFSWLNLEEIVVDTYTIAKTIVDQEDYAGLIYVTKDLKELTIYGNSSLPIEGVKKVLETYKTKKILEGNNVSKELIQEISKKTKIQVEFKSQSKSEIQKWIKGIVAVGSGYLVMMFVIIYGNSVMRSIIEEKNSRVVEIMICTVKPFQLMLGKIIGNALAGVLQFVIWAILLLVGLIALQGLFPSTGGEETVKIASFFEVIWSLNYLEICVSFVLFFLSGYLLYSGFYAAIGAAVNSETDTQQFVHPILLPLMFAVYIGMATVINGNPNGSTATMFSLIPFTSPILMLMRIPYGVPAWQIILSLALLLVSFITTVFVASKIYRIGILSYGNKPTMKQLVKWMFQKN